MLKMRRVMLLAAVVAMASNCNFFFAFAPDQLCETIIRAQCHFAFACCNAAERENLLFALAEFRSEGECIQESLEERGVCGNERQVHDAVNQGRFQYDSALAETCVKPAIDAANNCEADVVLGDAAEDPDGACEDVQGFAFGVGLVAEGDPCFEAFECADPGSICEQPEDDPEDDEILVTRVGSCRSPGKDGDDCTEDGTDGLCEEGTFCNGDECEAIVLGDNGDDCFADAQCESEFCNDLDFGVAPTCDDPLDDGEDCFDNNDCASEFCDFTEGVCAQPADVVVEACNGIQGDDTTF